MTVGQIGNIFSLSSLKFPHNNNLIINKQINNKLWCKVDDVDVDVDVNDDELIL